jgi:hypothetical protein
VAISLVCNPLSFFKQFYQGKTKQAHFN